MKKKRNLIYKLFIAASFLLPMVFAFSSLYMGTIPFWYDPARDLFMGLATHEKISLIGQTSGIPGIFYGPYWIWLLSLALFISHDPRVIAFLVLTLPYFILVPLLLFKFKKQFGTFVPLLLWLLFILSFSAYATQLWNPHHASLLCLLTIYLLVSQDYKHEKWKAYVKILVGGFVAGLLMNTHISFGLAVIVGSYLFLIFSKNILKTLPLFTVGLVTTFLPFFIFELRHGFNQIQTVLETITSSSAVVKESSVDKVQIINLFFNSFTRLLQIPSAIVYWLIGIIFGYIIYLVKKKDFSLGPEDKKLLSLIGTITVATVSIYLATKNPVWDYHFIGVEILFLLFLGLLAKKNAYVKYILLCWILILLTLGTVRYVQGLSADRYKTSSLATKEHIVDIIYNDAKMKPFAVYTYSPATFTPDFDYLLQWKGKSGNSAILNDTGNAELVYLIIPWTTKDLKADFIDNRTPNEVYKTIKTWHIADETEILKRERYEKK